jgi:hypothetical protein
MRDPNRNQSMGSAQWMGVQFEPSVDLAGEIDALHRKQVKHWGFHCWKKRMMGQRILREIIGGGEEQTLTSVGSGLCGAQAGVKSHEGGLYDLVLTGPPCQPWSS